VVGFTDAGANPGNFALARYTPDGALDPTFEGDGKVVTDFGVGELGFGVAIQPDGRIVAVGVGGAGDNPPNPALARYKADGSLDTTLEGGGKLVTDFGAFDEAFSVAIQADGKIVATGFTYAGGAAPPSFAMMRYDSDGSLDPSFDGDGRVITDFGAFDESFAIAIQPDGKIVSAGFSTAGDNPFNFALARFLPGEVSPANKSQCKNGGHVRFGFKNQGRCVAFVQHALNR